MTEMKITIKEATEAIQYWMDNAVLKVGKTLIEVRYVQGENVFVLKLGNQCDLVDKNGG